MKRNWLLTGVKEIGNTDKSEYTFDSLAFGTMLKCFIYAKNN